MGLDISETDLDLLRGASGVVALTDDGKDEILEIERRCAAMLAAELSATLFLVDRSERSWTETPFVRGPASVDELRELGIDHMVEQMEAALALGAPEVMGLAPSIPNFDAVLDSLEATHAEIVVTPTHLQRLRLFDRLQLHGSDIPSRVKDKAGDRHVVQVDDSGHMSIVVPTSG